MAFIISGVILFLAVVVGAVILFASGMSDSPNASRDAVGMAKVYFFGGVALAALVFASHWFPHIGW